MIFLINTRFQIAALLFYGVIFYDYFRNPKLPLFSNKIFSAIIIFTGFYLVFDILNVYTIINIKAVSPTFTRMIHQCFLGIMLVIVMTLFLYTQFLRNRSKIQKPLYLGLSVFPLIAMLFYLAFGHVEFYIDETSVYSYGPMAYISYLGVAFYIALIIYTVQTAGDAIRKERKSAITIGTSVWAVAAIVQFFNPEILASGIAIVLMLLQIYLSFEHPKEHFDEETATFNKHAFHLMLRDQYESNNNILVFSVVIDNLSNIQTIIGHQNASYLLETIAGQMREIFTDRVYHSRSNALTLLFQEPLEDLQNNISHLETYLNQTLTISYYSVAPKYHIDIINTNQVTSCDGVYELMNYMSQHHQSVKGKNVYLADDEVITQKRRYAGIEGILHHAIENDGFDVFYQPIFDVAAQSYHSAEALVRLKDNQTLGFISPEEFIVIAEQKGLIMDLGRTVFEKVCAFAKNNHLPSLGIDYIEVNLSGIQCVHPDLPRQLEAIMKKYQIEPKFLNLEITETASLESGDMLEGNMLRLRQLGCSFSMDDFGTGYSNLSKMAEVVYDLVKIDKSLIWPCFEENNEKSLTILKTVIFMLHKLNVKIVAEGVETQEMTDFLCEQQITYLQGYYFSKPLPENDFIEFLNNKLTA